MCKLVFFIIRSDIDSSIFINMPIIQENIINTLNRGHSCKLVRVIFISIWWKRPMSIYVQISQHHRIFVRKHLVHIKFVFSYFFSRNNVYIKVFFVNRVDFEFKSIDVSILLNIRTFSYFVCRIISYWSRFRLSYANIKSTLGFQRISQIYRYSIPTVFESARV